MIIRISSYEVKQVLLREAANRAEYYRDLVDRLTNSTERNSQLICRGANARRKEMETPAY